MSVELKNWKELCKEKDERIKELEGKFDLIVERLEEEREKSSDRFVGGRSNGKTLQMGITYGIEKTIRIVKEATK